MPCKNCWRKNSSSSVAELTGDQPDEITALAVTEGGELILNGDGAAEEEN